MLDSKAKKALELRPKLTVSSCEDQVKVRIQLEHQQVLQAQTTALSLPTPSSDLKAGLSASKNGLKLNLRSTHHPSYPESEHQPAKPASDKKRVAKAEQKEMARAVKLEHD